MSNRRCRCGHAQTAHHERTGPCRVLLCECAKFRRGAVLITRPPNREQIKAELDLLAQSVHTREDELVRQAFAVIAPYTYLRVIPRADGVTVQYYVPGGRGPQLDTVTGRTLAEALAQLVRNCS